MDQRSSLAVLPLKYSSCVWTLKTLPKTMDSILKFQQLTAMITPEESKTLWVISDFDFLIHLGYQGNDDRRKIRQARGQVQKMFKQSLVYVKVNAKEVQDTSHYK